MRVLHLVKTSEGAVWAAEQAAQLVARGVEVHVAVPRLEGQAIAGWRASGAVLHQFDGSLPLREPWRLPRVLAGLRRLVAQIRPDVIHSHFVTTTVTMRLALGRSHPIPRIFQVAGPLHLEHGLYRRTEIALAGPRDCWIGSSRYIVGLYERAGIPEDRLFLSYYGQRFNGFVPGRTGEYRERLGIAPQEIVVGSINYFYPPKRYLGQRVGIKRPELLIEALAELLPEEPRLRGVLAGGPWGRAQRYLDRLRGRAERLGAGRILLPGLIPPSEVAGAWPDFDLAVHVPLSENCGGVVEPLLCGVPVVASRTGGIPEVVVDGRTGVLVDDASPRRVASAIHQVMGDLDRYRAQVTSNRERVRMMFDVSRTGAEVHAIYRHLACGAPRPAPFEADGSRPTGAG